MDLSYSELQKYLEAAPGYVRGIKGQINLLRHIAARIGRMYEANIKITLNYNNATGEVKASIQEFF